MKYSGREVHRGGGDLVHPSARWGDLVDGSARHSGQRLLLSAPRHPRSDSRWLAAVTDAQLAIMRGPDRDAADHNVPRLDVAAGGDIDVIYDKGSTLYSNATPTGPVAAEVKAEVASAEAAPAKARL